MKRCAFSMILALVAVAALPGGASAHFFRWWCSPPAYGPYASGYGFFGFRHQYAAPYYPAPLYQAYPYFVPYYVVPAAAPVAVPAQPAITPRAAAPAVPLRAPIVTVTPETPPVGPKTEEVRPAKIDSPVSAPAPMNAATIPNPMVPKSPLELPKIPGSDSTPVAPTPNAVPTPAPAPSAAIDPLPPITLPEPRKVLNGKDAKDDLPPLVLPPETSKSPSGVIPNISRSSPLTGGVKVQVFAAAGTPFGELRKVGFFNHTNRDLDLVIAGKAVKLPKKSYLNAELPPKFTWKHSGGTAESATVPDGAAGLDLLFQE